MNKQRLFTLVLVPILLFFLLSLTNLKSQYSFKEDPARDTLASLRILRSKEITMIGPPLSLGQNGLRETYFSSAIYYLGALGLFVSGGSPTGPVVFIALINASALIPLFLILQKRKYSDVNIFLIMLLYVTNPVIINYSRILWNPSPLIGIGMWGVYAFSQFPIIFGLIGGLALYFHYFGVLMFMSGIALYVKEKKYNWFWKATSAFVVSLVPFLFFEFRNEFYLTQSLIYNIQNTPGSEFLAGKLHILITLPAVLLGVSSDFFGARFIDLTKYSTTVGLLMWIAFVIFHLKSWNSIFFYSAVFLTIIASKDMVRLQYSFIGIGGLVALCIPKLQKVGTYIVIFLIAIQSVNTLYSIRQPAHIFGGQEFPTITQLEETRSLIVDSHVSGKKFNVTENITGDARAGYLRFFFENDQALAIADLQNELSYDNLDELYVLTPSVTKTMTERRWELTATPDLKLVSSQDVGAYKLLKYVRAEGEHPR